LFKITKIQLINQGYIPPQAPQYFQQNQFNQVNKNILNSNIVFIDHSNAFDSQCFNKHVLQPLLEINPGLTAEKLMFHPDI